jgi:NADPH-dependent curcumin reductase CurA
MPADLNRRILLARHPQGMPCEADFALDTTAVPVPGEGQILIRAHYLSCDPLQRIRMAESATYGATIPLGTVVWGRQVGVVVASRHAGFRAGDIVEGMLGWQDFSLSDGGGRRAEYAPGITRVDPTVAPITTSLGVLGMPGVTAYFALTEIGRPRQGETVVVSGAAGTVGSLAGQIAKLMGCRVIGIAGGAAKVAHVTGRLGFDAAIDYRATSDIAAALRALAPEGVDVYFDNVGGPIRDAVLRVLRRGARIALVGRISRMHDAAPTCPDPQVPLMHARALMQGFIVYDYEHRAEEARSAVAAWIRDGRIRYDETIVDGFENTPRAFIDMLGGGNLGKMLVRV